MKEATGELNLTVVVVIIVAALAFFFFSVLWPQINGNFVRNTQCNKAICKCPNRDGNGNCIAPADGMVDCYLKENPGLTFKCSWKG